MIISEEYKNQLEIMHTAEKKRLGHGVEPAEKLVETIKSYPITTVLDFGCGQGNMMSRLAELFPNLKIQGYDPGVERYSKLPTTPVDLIYSADVLEHIEPDHLVDVLKNLWKLGQHGPAGELSVYHHDTKHLQQHERVFRELDCSVSLAKLPDDLWGVCGVGGCFRFEHHFERIQLAGER